MNDLELMSLQDRLRNPQWAPATSTLDADRALTDMALAAARIARLESAINRYLAGSLSCNGGAERLFELALGDDPMPMF